jgi:outer membrane protein assembly factor BamB
VCQGAPKTRSYDPATGKQLWELGGMSGQPHASPVASADLLFVGGGGSSRFGAGGGGEEARGKPLFAVKAGASGDISLKDGATSNDGVAWYSSKDGPSMASPLLYDGYLYILEQRGGLLTCIEAKTGKQIYKERLGGRGFTSSPWAYNGKVFCLGDDGQTYVVQAGAEFKVLGKNGVGEMCWSSPAVAGGALYLRTIDELFCIKTKE